MITLKQGMDQYSLEILRKGDNPGHVGYIQWHPGRQPRIVLSESFGQLSLPDVERVFAGYRAHRERVKFNKSQKEPEIVYCGCGCGPQMLDKGGGDWQVACSDCGMRGPTKHGKKEAAFFWKRGLGK
jgi:hypothetical protein